MSEQLQHWGDTLDIFVSWSPACHIHGGFRDNERKVMKIVTATKN